MTTVSEHQLQTAIRKMVKARAAYTNMILACPDERPHIIRRRKRAIRKLKKLLANMVENKQFEARKRDNNDKS